MQLNNNKILKSGLILLFILLFVICFRYIIDHNSYTLSDYAKEHPQSSSQDVNLKESEAPETLAESQESFSLAASEGKQTENASSESTNLENMMDNENSVDNTLEDENSMDHISEDENSMDNTNQDMKASENTSTLPGASRNADTQIAFRESVADAFYSEPLSEELKSYITGVSYPDLSGQDTPSQLVITYDDLRYVHILYMDFDGKEQEGELICNQRISKDLLEIFYELYQNDYQIERICLIEDYNGDDNLSMRDNNTSCFNYRMVEGTTSISKHAYGLAIDVNPFYNPYITYNSDKTPHISPEGSEPYADRTQDFPYKIDENDLCYKLFKQHGFTWGGNWNSTKDYQHFQMKP